MPISYPPGPQDLCFGLRSMSQMKSNVLGYYTMLHEKYGDAVSYRIGPYRLYVFFHPDQIHEVLVTKSKGMIREPRVMQTFAQWNGNSILIVEGDDWIRQRRLVQQGFQQRRFAAYANVIAECSEQLATRWHSLAHKQGGSMEAPIRGDLTELTLAIIGRTLFDTDLTLDSSGIARAVAILSEVAFHEMQAPFRMPHWWPTQFYRQKRWAIKQLDELVWNIVRSRRAEGKDHGDLLSMLLDAVDDEENGTRLDDRQVRDEAVTLLLAGHDSSAAALEWLCYLLAKHPQVQDRCRSEVTAVLGNRTMELADVSQLSYLQAVIKETMLIYPPAIGVFLRQTTKPLTIGNYDIPPKSLISLSSYVTQRDARWFPNPDQFDPDRFLPPRADSIPQGAYFPFGLGPRVCIGQAFAMIELTMVAATLLRHLSVAVPSGSDDPQPQVYVALRPSTPIRLRWSTL